MGDRTYVNYTIGGAISQLVAEDLAEYIGEEGWCVGDDPYEGFGTTDEHFAAMVEAIQAGKPYEIAAGEVNYGYEEELEQRLTTAGLQWKRSNGDGGSYPAAYALQMQDGSEELYLPHTQGEFTANLPELLKLGEAEGAEAVLERIKQDNAVQDWEPAPLTGELQLPEPEPEPEGERKTFTGFCQAATGKGTIWIEAVEAVDADHAKKLARQACADAWEYKLDRVHVLGIAEGDVEIVDWHDLGC